MEAGCIARLIVVLGRDAELVRDALTGVAASMRFVPNVDYQSGMSSSLCEGVRAVIEDEQIDAALVALGDQPELRQDVVRSVAHIFLALPAAERPGSIVVPRYEKVPGHPVLFGRRVLPELLDITGDRGGRAVVERDLSRVHHADFAFPAPRDIDTADDLRALLARSGARGDA